jgi:hypothetical protein
MSVNFCQTAECHIAVTNPIAFSVAGLSVTAGSVETQYIRFVWVRSDANIAVEYNPDFLCVHYLVCGLSIHCLYTHFQPCGAAVTFAQSHPHVRMKQFKKQWMDLHEVGFEVFTAVTMKNAVFWDVAPCRSCVNRHFRGTYRLHFQGRKIHERGFLTDFSTLKMETIHSSKTSVRFTGSTWRHVPEDGILRAKKIVCQTITFFRSDIFWMRNPVCVI